MLVLGRKAKEFIVINDGIVIQVVRIDRNQVKIGIEAPDHVVVDRAEVWVEKQKKGDGK